MKCKELIIKASVLVFVIIVFVVLNRVIDITRGETIKRTNTGAKTVYDIDYVTEIGNKYIIHGWFFEMRAVRNVKHEVINEAGDYCVLLVDQEYADLKEESTSIKGCVGSMSYLVREDVNSYFECEYDYSHCGFEASFDKDDLVEDHVYRVYVKPKVDEYDATETQIYICNGEIYYTNPKEKTAIVSRSPEIKKIIEEGILLVNREDFGIYIYQCGRQLYWIADKNAYFEKEGTYMQYQLETTQFDRLPSSRTDNGWYWGNIGDLFETHELAECNIDGYRVMVRDIPTEYSVTLFEVGFYAEGKWIWREVVRPCYSMLDNRFNEKSRGKN